MKHIRKLLRQEKWCYYDLTLTCAEGRFRPCLPILQNPQQFSDELQNYTLHFTQTHRTLCWPTQTI